MKTLIIALLFTVMVMSFCFGVWYGTDGKWQLSSGSMTTEDAIAFLNYARESHQYYVDYPGKMLNKDDGVKKQERYVEIYTELIALIKSLE